MSLFNPTSFTDSAIGRQTTASKQAFAKGEKYEKRFYKKTMNLIKKELKKGNIKTHVRSMDFKWGYYREYSQLETKEMCEGASRAIGRIQKELEGIYQITPRLDYGKAYWYDIEYVAPITKKEM